MPEQTPAPVPGSQQSQAPFGTSGATGPTPNRGYEAAGLQKLGSVVKQLEEMTPLFGSSSEIGQEVLKTLNRLAKYVPAGSMTPAAERNNIQQMATRNAQQDGQLKALQQRQGQQGQPV
jgi:hypothetical protein